MRTFRVNHASVGKFSAGQVVTEDQIAAAAKANHVTFDVDDWVKTEAVTEVQPAAPVQIKQPPAAGGAVEPVVAGEPKSEGLPPAGDHLKHVAVEPGQIPPVE